MITLTVLFVATLCRQLYKGQIFGGSVQRGLDAIHFLSAGSVGFARGLNDTPKIVALLLVIKTFDVKFGMVAHATDSSNSQRYDLRAHHVYEASLQTA